MASNRSKLFNLFLQLVNKKKFLGNQLASRKASFLDSPEPTAKVKKTCHIRRFDVNGHNVFTIVSKNAPKSNIHILYLHGGAYVQRFNTFHWGFLARLTQSTGCTITAPDYPLVPEHTYKDSFAMVSILYRQIIHATESRNFIVMGDSSGGGFALALAQKMRKEGMSQPNDIILLSPWLDLKLENASISDIESQDPFLEKQSLQQAGKLYAGDTDPGHYLLSPIYGPLNNLGKLSVFIGSKEILVADARKLKELATANAIPFDYYEYKDMIHGWMFLNFPESKMARQQIIDIIRQSE